MKNLYSIAIIEYGVPNKNNRIYSMKTVEQVVAATKGEVLGTFAEDYTSNVVDLDHVSHTASNFRTIEGFLLCDITVLETPKGKVLQELLNQKVPIAFRSAGVGQFNTLEDGTVEVTEFVLTSVSAMNADDAA